MTLVELKISKSVKIFFPTRGHSFLPCDRAFGLIKRKLKKSSRVYTIDQYADIIRSSSDNPDKFKIILVNSTTMLDYQNWFKQYYIKQTKDIHSRVGVSQKPENFSVYRDHYFECNESNPMILHTSEYIDGFVSYSFKLRKPNTHPISLPTKIMYANKVPILEDKMSDLQKLKGFYSSRIRCILDRHIPMAD